MAPGLWAVAESGFAILLMLIAQVVMVLLWGGNLVFHAMRAHYDAAIISSAYVELALGAMPNAIVIRLYVGWFA